MEDGRFNLLMTVLIASQQVYRLTRYDLQQECETRGITWPEGVEEYIILAAKEASEKPVVRAELLQRVQGSMVKMLSEDMVKHELELHQQDAEQRKTREALRSGRKIKIFTDQLDKEVDRGSLVLYAGREVQTQLDGPWDTYIRPTWNAPDLDTHETMLSLVTKPHRNKLLKKDERRNSITVGRSKWMGCGRSGRAWDKFIESFLPKMVGGRIDVLVVRDTQYLLRDQDQDSWRHCAVRNAHVGLKHIWKWAKANNVVVVAGIPFDAVQFDDSVEQFYDTVESTFAEYATIIKCTGEGFEDR